MVSGSRTRVPVGPSLGFCLALCLYLRPSVFLFSVSPRSVSPIPSVSHPLVSLFLELCLSFYIPLRLSPLSLPFCRTGPFSFPLSLRLSLPTSPLFSFPLLLSLLSPFQSLVSLHLSLPFSESLPLYPHLSLLFSLSLSLSLSSLSPRVSTSLWLYPSRPPLPPPPPPHPGRFAAVSWRTDNLAAATAPAPPPSLPIPAWAGQRRGRSSERPGSGLGDLAGCPRWTEGR